LVQPQVNNVTVPLRVHSFHTLIADLATLTRNTVEIATAPGMPFSITARPTPIQAKAFHLLEVTCTQQRRPSSRF
jgi:hypothetical protein